MKELAAKVNFFVFSLVGVVGAGMASEIFKEDDVPDKMDDIWMLILAVISYLWYRKSSQKWQGIAASYAILFMAIAVKILAILVEYKDAEAVGDDIGIAVVLVISLLYITILSYQMKKKIREV